MGKTRQIIWSASLSYTKMISITLYLLFRTSEFAVLLHNSDDAEFDLHIKQNVPHVIFLTKYLGLLEWAF